MAVTHLWPTTHKEIDPTPEQIRQRSREVLEARKTSPDHREAVARGRGWKPGDWERVSRRRSQLIAALRRHGTLRMPALKVILGVSQSTVWADLTKLIADGVIEVDGPKTRQRYRLSTQPVEADGVDDLPTADRIIAAIQRRAWRKGVRR